MKALLWRVTGEMKLIDLPATATEWTEVAESDGVEPILPLAQLAKKMGGVVTLCNPTLRRYRARHAVTIRGQTLLIFFCETP